MPDYATWRLPQDITVRRRLTASSMTDVSDRAQVDSLKKVMGRAFDTSGSPVTGATVLLFRQSDNLFIKQTTTDADGYYVFTRDSGDTLQYYTVGFTIVGGVTQIHGTSNRNLVPG